MATPSQTLLPGSSGGPHSSQATTYQATKARIAAMNQGPKSGLLGMGLLIIVPWLAFSAIGFAFAFVFHSYALATWAIVISLIIVSLTFFVLDQRNRFGGKWYTKLGVLTLFATLASMYLGLANYYNNFAQYWSYKQNVKYMNVLPSEPAASHSDGGKLLFTIDSKVDIAKSVGYKSSSTYCVAPIIDYATTVIEYWAVGKDCCGARGGFTCSDVWSPKARSGVVILQEESGFNKDIKHYKDAANQATAEWQLTQSKRPLFVKWVLDSGKEQDSHFTAGLSTVIIEVAAYLLLSIILGIIVQMSSRGPSAKAGGNPYQNSGGAMSTMMGGLGGSMTSSANAIPGAAGPKIRLPSM